MLLDLIIFSTIAAIIVSIIISITEMTYFAKINVDMDRDLLLIRNGSKFGIAWNIGVWIWFTISTVTLFQFFVSKIGYISLSFIFALFIGSIISFVIMSLETIIRYEENYGI